MNLIFFAILLLASQGGIDETANLKFNEITVSINTKVEQRTDDYIYTYSLKNNGKTLVLISLSAIDKIARPEHILIELSPKEKRDFTLTSKISSVRFGSKIEIYVPDTQPRYLYNNGGAALAFTKGKFWMLTYGDVISTYLPSNLTN